MKPQIVDVKPTESEESWREFAEDLLIRVYVPEAEQLTRQEAIELAMERDEQAARELYEDVMGTTLCLDRAAAVAVAA